MFKNINKTKIFDSVGFTKLLLTLFFSGTLVALAYNTNSSTAPANNTVVIPVYVDTNQSKSGNIDVNAFNVPGESVFFDKVNLGNGSYIEDPTGTIKIGDTTNPVDINTTGSFTINDTGSLKVSSLSGSGNRPICSDSAGKIVACTPVLPPSISMQQFVFSGTQYELIWSATGATQCSGSYNDFNTNGETTGDAVVTASLGSVISITCTGAGGSTTQSITLQ